jgi:hypothetical protein
MDDSIFPWVQLNSQKPLFDWLMTHIGGEGVEDLEAPVVLPALAKVVVKKVRPEPRHPLSPCDDVTHPGDSRRDAR